MTVFEQAVEAALLANMHPLAEPSETERKHMRAALRAALPIVGEELARVATDEDGHFTIWGEDRNTVVAQTIAKDAAAALRARLSEIMEGK